MTDCSSFKKDTLRKHQLSMKHRLAQDSYTNKQQFLSTPKIGTNHLLYAMHVRIQQKKGPIANKVIKCNPPKPAPQPVAGQSGLQKQSKATTIDDTECIVCCEL